MLDITIYESGDGGDLHLKNDDLTTIKGLTNNVYLALFGGNVEQSTSLELSQLDQRLDYWGNEYLEIENQFNSEFERALNEVALNSGGITTLINAAEEDLKFLKDYADINIDGSITGVGKFHLQVQLTEPGGLSTKLNFIWDNMKGELIEQEVI